MNKVFINLILLSQLFLVGCITKPAYKEIDIGECKISIPSSLKQFTHESKYEYYFSVEITPKNFYDELKSMSTQSVNYSSAEKFIKKMREKDSPFKFIKKFADGNHTIVQYYFDGLENDFNYRVYLDDIMIQFINIPMKDVHDVLEYCNKTKK